MRSKGKITLLLFFVFIQISAKDTNNIIAIIDTGIDTTNCYINSSFVRSASNDIVGWNFLGNKDNTINPPSIGKESFRIMQLLHSKYSDTDSSTVLNENEKVEFENYLFFRKAAGIDTYISFAELLKYNYEAFVYLDSVIVSQNLPRDIAITDLQKIDYSAIPDSMETPLTQVMSECTKAYYSGIDSWDLAFKHTEDEYLLSKERLSTLGLPESNPRFSIDDDPYNFDNLNYGNSNITAEPNEHATAIASIISSTHNDARGINTNALILPIRVTSAGEAFDKDLYSGIILAVDKGADIILIPQTKEYSLHGDKLNEALLYASENNVVVVLNAGDRGKELRDEQLVPSGLINNDKLDNIIRVGALNEKGERLAKSNFGSVDVFVNGENIKTVNGDGKITLITGTDAASAVVAGIASIMKEKDSNITAKQIIEQLIAGSN